MSEETTTMIKCEDCGQPATVRVYWVEPGTPDDQPAAGEAELCAACALNATEPWSR